MSNDFLSIMKDHADVIALVAAEGNARGKVVAAAKACKGKVSQEAFAVALWGARMVQYVIANVKGANGKNALGMVAAEKAKAVAERATWYKAGDNAARNYAYHVRKEAGLVATDKRGGKRDNAGRKGKGATNEETTAPVADKPVADKPVKAPALDKAYRPASAKEGAMFARATLASLVSIVKPNASAAFIKALNDALAAAQAEIKNCE